MKLDYWKNLKERSDTISESLVSLFEELSPKDIPQLYKIKDLVAKMRNIAGKSIWTSRSFYEFFGALNPYRDLPHSVSLTTRQQVLLKDFSLNEIPENKYAMSELFVAIYKDQCLSHRSKTYKSLIKMPQNKKILIVLIDGFVNELYQTPSFSRSLHYLNEEFGFEFYIPKVNGLATSSTNKESIYQNLLEAQVDHPDKKIWCFGFSKGGVDALHCALEYSDFFKENVLGISTISSPLRGTQISDHYIIKKFDSLLRSFQDGKFIAIAEELSESHLDSWFENNLSNFPQNIFYSSLGFASPISKSHIFMKILKILAPNSNPNDGIVEEARAHFPHFFPSLNLGTIPAHHLVGLYSSQFDQEALIKSHLILLNYLNKI